jgi:hypothetical protein
MKSSRSRFLASSGRCDAARGAMTGGAVVAYSGAERRPMTASVLVGASRVMRGANLMGSVDATASGGASSSTVASGVPSAGSRTDGRGSGEWASAAESASCLPLGVSNTAESSVVLRVDGRWCETRTGEAERDGAGDDGSLLLGVGLRGAGCASPQSSNF